MILVNPDVHGRTFWKDPIVDDYSQVIFLGDYLDPYPWENIDKKEAINNFKEILDLKKIFPDKITLLLGNHDTHYLFGNDDCRIDSVNYDEIRNLFIENYELFKIGIVLDKISFTHAPIHPEWKNNSSVKNVLGETDDKSPEDVINKLNNLWNKSVKKNNYLDINKVLGKASWIRGGLNNCGSPIWADVRELSDEDDPWPGYYQIFGHTQLREGPAIFNHFACLDCRKPFEVLKEEDKVIITEA